MLSISQKESILRKAGVPIPPFPTRRPPPPLRFDEDGTRYVDAERSAGTIDRAEYRTAHAEIEARLFEDEKRARSDRGRQARRKISPH